MIRHGTPARAFTVDGEHGNAAFVFATEAAAQVDFEACVALARRQQGEVTWLRRGAGSADAGLRFFTPGGEIAFCGHGLLAAAAWADAHDGPRASRVFEIGGKPVSVLGDGARRWSYAQDGGGSEPLDAGLLDDALRALGIARIDALRAAGATLARSVGAPREKLLLELPDAALLAAILIDPAQRDALCERLGATGIYVFAVRDRVAPRLAARHFPHRVGTQEDMATGGIAPTVVRYARLAEAGTAAGAAVVIDQGGPACGLARLVVSPSAGAWRVAGECVIEPAVPLVGIVREVC
ncbi:PhzF family phenazine biosynthesis protein [Burkholderia glumae]|uniref:PhzF family phenazine biosynthesis protein n=1 Tax=Burkholderia glumae TaxID=337 RepID=UPI002036FCB2|nr:PhzF family phenazine biosynthesis protein [Burkholderia glumae]MCM2541438.1 PhzF family phenazine biosynthesis protein [Burkholderia glumae]